MPIRRKMNPAKVPEDHVGLLAHVNGREISLALLDLYVLEDLLSAYGAWDDIPDDDLYLAILGYIEAYNYRQQHLEVQASVAKRGWGPPLYDSLLWWSDQMPDKPSVIPDTITVSSAARNIWLNYYRNRPDVVVVGPGPKSKHVDDFLRVAYAPGPDFDWRPFVDMADRFDELGSSFAGLAIGSLKARIVSAGSKLFWTVYEKYRRGQAPEWRRHPERSYRIPGVATDDQLRQLRDEAGSAGDYETVSDCDAALEGDADARGRCEDIIRRNPAQDRPAKVAVLDLGRSRYSVADEVTGMEIISVSGKRRLSSLLDHLGSQPESSTWAELRAAAFEWKRDHPRR